jgi:hypothetical protein
MEIAGMAPGPLLRWGGTHRRVAGAFTMSRPSSSDKSSDPAATTSAVPDTASPQAGTSPSGGGTAGRLRLEPGVEPVPGFTLVQLLGRGGFGEVWKAKGPGGFSVAMKFIPLGEAAGAVELRALELMKDARHAHLLGQFGAWERGGVLVVAMELADRTLSDRLREAVRQGCRASRGRNCWSTCARPPRGSTTSTLWAYSTATSSRRTCC